MAEPERHHVRHIERAVAQALAVAVACGAGRGDMAERVGALIAEIGGVRRAADAEGIQNEEECARHPQAWVILPE